VICEYVSLEYAGDIDLKEVYAKYKLFFDCTLDMVFFIDGGGKILDTNTMAVSVYGYSREEMLSMNIRDLRTPGEQASVKKLLEEVFFRGIVYETVHRRKDGSEFPVEISSRGVKIDGTKLMISIVRDITDRKRGEEALRESEEKFRALAESSPGAIFIYRGDRHISVNPAAERITGYSKDELYQQRITDFVHPDFKELVLNRALARQRGERVPSQYEFKIITKSGEIKWVLQTAICIMYQGKPAGVATMFDITERKRTEERLQLTQFAVDHFTDSSIWIDHGGGIIYVNDATCSSTGYDRSELLSMHIWDIDPLYSPEVFARNWKNWEVVSGHKGENRFESVHRTKSGKIFPVEITGNFFIFKGHKYFVTYDRDITKRKQVEEALRESERKFRAIFDQTLQFIGLLASDGTLLEANQTALKFVGAAESDVIGKPFWDTPWWRHSPELRARLQEAVAKAQKGELVRFDATFAASNGSLHYFDFSLKPVADERGKVIMLIPEGREITERKRAEAAMLKSEANLAKAQRLAHVGSYSLDTRTYRGQCSDEFYRILGIVPRDFLSFQSFLECIHPEDRAVFEREYRGSIDRGGIYCGEFRIVWPNDEVRTIYGDGEPVLDEAGCTVEIFGIIQDITERKRAEEAITDAKAQAELYLDLMSHDIINMNQALMGYLELIEVMRETGEIDKALIDRSMEIIHRSSRLISDVKKLTQVQAGKVPPKAVDVCNIMALVKADYSEVPGRQVTIRYTPKQGCIVIASDLIKDALENLVDNAIRHSTGPVTIDLAVNMVTLEGRAYYQITVSDTGPGIPDDLKKKIFVTLKEIEEKSERRGFGLYMVRTLVEFYHGNVWVEDRIPGNYKQGSRFVVMLPSAEP